MAHKGVDCANNVWLISSTKLPNWNILVENLDQDSNVKHVQKKAKQEQVDYQFDPFHMW